MDANAQIDIDIKPCFFYFLMFMFSNKKLNSANLSYLKFVVGNSTVKNFDS